LSRHRSNGLVLGPGRVDFLVALGVVAFAEELHRGVIQRDRLAERLDLLVDVPEQLLVLGFSRVAHQPGSARGLLRSTISRPPPRFSTTVYPGGSSTTASPAVTSSCPRTTKNRAECDRTASYSAL